MSKNNPSAVIFGCAGLTLSPAEKDFFTKVNPLGFIVFKRNIESREQLKALVKSLRDCVGRDDAPVLIDQEGGRVCRLTSPVWEKYPPARLFGDLYDENPLQACDLAYNSFRLIGADLKEVDIDVDCAPDLDLPVEESNEVILGDRTFGIVPEKTSVLGQAVCEGLMAEGVMPVMKHLPGHGRAKTDSHFELPVVDADIETLKQTDFKAFRLLNQTPWAMTAHILYTKIDDEKPASLSKKVIDEVIRGEIGFDGFLICDDLSMKALSGSFSDLTTQAIQAGCDAVLHCNGEMAEMVEIASTVLALSDKSFERFKRGLKALKTAKNNAKKIDYKQARIDLNKAVEK